MMNNEQSAGTIAEQGTNADDMHISPAIGNTLVSSSPYVSNRREIIFRGWHTKANKMFSPWEMGQDQLTIMPDGKGFINVHSLSTKLSQLIPEMIPMQYTGRQDAEINGTDVYESDVIENCDTKELQIVFWNEDEAAWFCQYINEKRIVSLADSLGNLNKVKGNVYENPELLSSVQ